MLIQDVDSERILGLGETDCSQGLPTMGDFSTINDDELFAMSSLGAWTALGFMPIPRRAATGAMAVTGLTFSYFAAKMATKDPNISRFASILMGMASGLVGAWSLYDIYQTFQRSPKLSSSIDRLKNLPKIVTG